MHGATLKDSIKAVYTLIRSNFREFGVPEQRLKTQTVAVHLVKIAEPKDGPSAGLAFLVGMVSALANKPVKPGFAFTGEVAIHGEVGAVGGIPPKLNAAVKAGRKEVVIPLANAGDVPGDVKGKITVHTIASAMGKQSSWRSANSRLDYPTFFAAFSMAAASARVVAERASPRSMRASSSMRSASVVSGRMVVVVRLPTNCLRIVHW